MELLGGCYGVARWLLCCCYGVASCCYGVAKLLLSVYFGMLYGC